MPKEIRPRKLIRILEQHGFILQQVRGSHHLFRHPITKRRVIVLLHAKDLSPGTLHQILKDAGLSEEEL